MLKNKLSNVLDIIGQKKTLQINLDDWFLASYPRSGNTWIRLMIANLFFENVKIDSLITLQEYVPDIHFQKKARYKKINGKYKIVKTHNPFYEGLKNVLYIYRNPLDVAWSYFNFLKETGNSNPTDIDDFIKKNFDGSIAFGRWDEHVSSFFYEQKEKDNKIYFFQYEEINKNPKLFLEALTKIVHNPKSEKEIDEAIEKSSPQLVKQLTNDELFYGKKTPQFVTTPISGDSQLKQEFKRKYLDLFKKEISIFDFDSNTLRLK